MDTSPTPAQPPPSAAHHPPQSQHSQFALYAALQTMKKRCLTLQQRLTSVEEENLALRQRTIPAPAIAPVATSPAARRGQLADREREQLVYDLQLQVQQLAQTRQQATDRLAMIATENRQLWARLSQLTKPQPGALIGAGDGDTLDDTLLDADQLITTLIGHEHQTIATSPNQNLIRSKTFTQNAPNPALRVRMTNVDAAEASSQHRPASFADDVSLEEISLKVLNEFLEKKTIAEQLCNEMAADVLQETETADVAAAEADSFGFGFLSDEADVAANVADMQADLKRCADGMVEIRKEVLCQQSDIKVALSNLRQRRFLEVCPACKHHLRHDTGASKSTTSCSAPSTSPTGTVGVVATVAVTAVHIDLLEQKRIADAVDKMCPMCAKLYSSATSFDTFKEHVESHFVDDSELDNGMEYNFELVSHSVGDF